MTSLQTLGGISAILNSLIYISAFVFFGVFWDYPKESSSIEQLVFVAENQAILSVVYFVIYVVFGVLLSTLVLTLYQRMRVTLPVLSQAAAMFGVIWVGLVIASGMVANIGLAVVLDISAVNPEQAMTVMKTINAVVNGLGGGNEVVGGLWVFLVSIAAIKAHQLPKYLHYIGLFIGVAGILSAYPADIFKEVFGLGQIVWFAWLGGALVVTESKPQ